MPDIDKATLAQIDARAAEAGSVLVAWRLERRSVRTFDLMRLHEVCASAADVPVLVAALRSERVAREKAEAAGATLRETLALFGGPPVCIACGDVSVREHDPDCPIGHTLASDVGEALLVRVALGARAIALANEAACAADPGNPCSDLRRRARALIAEWDAALTTARERSG